MAKDTAETPLMKQYYAIKAKYPGALLLFRVGDFYETFEEDAVQASRILEITLTKRGNGTASEVALAGFPHHALDAYLPRLVRAGLRVAICDQLEDPKTVKGIVKRGVTELVTPGVSFHDQVLEVKRNNYLASVFAGDHQWGIAFLDISTGEFSCTQGNVEYIDKLIQSYQPAELLYPKGKRKALEELNSIGKGIFPIEDWVYGGQNAREILLKHFGTTSLKGFGIEEWPDAATAAGAIIHYLHETEHRQIAHLNHLARIEEERYVWLDRFTIRNLELVQAQQAEGVSLLHILDRSQTAMGGRLLKKWLLLPLKEAQPIQERLATVQYFLEHPSILEGLEEALEPIGDLERLIAKVATARINPREMQLLKRSLDQITLIQALLKEVESPLIKRTLEQLNPCLGLVQTIGEQLREDPPVLLHHGKIIKDGVHAELDELRVIAYTGKDYLLQIQQREVARTSIPSLKISYNKVFGYYLEVTNTHKDKVPSDWIRKQTLVNAERYITEELKVYEEKILTAEDKMLAIEQVLFQDLVRKANEYIALIQINARLIATLDVLAGFARVATENDYCKPEVQEGLDLHIKAGRHPVIEKQLPRGEVYIPNDIVLDTDTQQIMIITGPNMAGKSALLRQTALIVLMAQIGSFVPASAATIGIVDKVFTRVGASDNLSKGESTFMVEMNETASILNNLSARSLIIMDEIGRGTSTYDGISIAWAIVEFLHQHAQFKPKTLFATHYHELNQLASTMDRVKNFNVSVKESGNKVVFLRKLKPGGSEHSFGIHVAQMAGMPSSVVLRANEVMHDLEASKEGTAGLNLPTKVPTSQMSIFEMADPAWAEIKQRLTQLDINGLSPVEALLKLHDLQLVLKKH